MLRTLLHKHAPTHRVGKLHLPGVAAHQRELGNDGVWVCEGGRQQSAHAPRSGSADFTQPFWWHGADSCVRRQAGSPWLVHCVAPGGRAQKSAALGVACCCSAAQALSPASTQRHWRCVMGLATANVQKKNAAALATRQVLAVASVASWPRPNWPTRFTSASSYVTPAAAAMVGGRTDGRMGDRMGDGWGWPVCSRVKHEGRLQAVQSDSDGGCADKLILTLF
jgi:hypothetical protein